MSLRIDLTEIIIKEIKLIIKQENKYRSKEIELTPFDIFMRANAAADQALESVYDAIKSNDDF